MTRSIQRETGLSTATHNCDRCGRPISNGRGFAFKLKGTQLSTEGAESVSEVTKCFSCALRHRPMLRRSLIAALVVGSVLTALNQGDTLLSGEWNNALYWKIPLTFCVPFIVATYGALTNSRK